MILLFVAALVAVGGIGFALGHLTAPAATAAANAAAGASAASRGASLAPGQTFNAERSSAAERVASAAWPAASAGRSSRSTALR